MPPLHGDSPPTQSDERSRLLHFERYSYSTQHPNPHIHDPNTDAPMSQKASSKVQQLKRHLLADLSIKYTDWILLLCFLISGMMDAGAYNAYSCFVSMQTGNTIFAALGVSDLPVASPVLAWTKSVTSVFAFLTGSYVLSSLHRRAGERKRWVFVCNFAAQAVCTGIAVWMVEKRFTSGSPASPKEGASLGLLAKNGGWGFPRLDLVPIALLSFQASGMIVASRMLRHHGMPTIVLTSAYNDIMSDPGLFSGGLTGNVSRNRKLGGVVLYFLGAVCGGALARSQFGFAGTLWTSIIIKLVIAGGWLAWREETKEEREG
ncbi:hypothetical protein LTR95_014102 [Oleoguttula sp. CCFEE 5521]